MSDDAITPSWNIGDELPARLECLAAKLRSLGQVTGADSVRVAEALCVGIGKSLDTANELSAVLYALAGEPIASED